MPEQSRSTPPDAVLGGVFEADASRPPEPPADATALQVTDEHGIVIAYTWVAPEHAGSHLLRTAWRWHRERTTRAASALTLLP